MSLPAAWVEALFAKLNTRYGVAFMRQYGDIDPAVIKADWAEVLDGTGGESIAYALRYLPVERPPTALQFRDQCRRAPPPELPKLAAPHTPADPERVAQAMAAVKGAERSMHPAAYCAQRLREIRDGGRRLTIAQQDQLRACERLTGDAS